ncbi:hypothetical protein ACHHYP_10811 [Achlya hypogyna]|uniref:G-patch domain-containing protein n=1 Tax=Achlya hypogyna TaxID=1202772 RepID=A0A1V9YKJ2_ACHHY|nr:hypothetical protein ACHHYP_10811 [Achlya hypogyna]
MQPRKREDKRFHGAFTGGFSAGYYNTVGSKEGWKPKTFQSSRAGGDGAPVQQRIEDFLDEEDDQLLGRRLELASKYDPHNATSDATSKHLQAQQASHSSIPGFIPDDFITPSRDSVGTKLLGTMGWKPGQGVGPKIRKSKLSRFDDAPDDVVYIAPKNNVDVSQFPAPKNDNYGVGYDPYVDAPEFAFLKRRQDAAKAASGQRQIMTFADAMKAGSSGMGHGLSALEENDDYDVYAIETRDNFDRELHDNSRKRLRAPAAAKSATKDKSFAVCSDGRPPLVGFVLNRTHEKPPKVLLATIVVPPTYQPGRHRPTRPTAPDLYRDHAFSLPKRGVSTTLSAAQRGALLGERAAKPPELGAQVRAGMLAAMASRFQSASATPSETPAPAADLRKPLQRSTLPWKPDRLLCKRFRVQRPDEVVDGSAKKPLVDESQARFDREIVSHLAPADGPKAAPTVVAEELPALPPVVRPPEDLFKSIFDVDELSEEDASSSSDEDEPDERQEQDAQRPSADDVSAPAHGDAADSDSSGGHRKKRKHKEKKHRKEKKAKKSSKRHREHR